MKRLALVILPLILSLVLLNTALCETEVRGEVSGVWDIDGAPYIITGDCIVDDEDTLVIDAGVEVLSGNHPLIILGLLIAEGTEDDSILFGLAGEAEAWQGLYFAGADTSTILEYCVFTSGHSETVGEQDSTDGRGGNIYLSSSDITIINSRISSGHANSDGGGCFIKNSSPTFMSCEFTENESRNYGGAVSLRDSSNPTFVGCNFSLNEAGAYGGAMLIWGGCEITLEDCSHCSEQIDCDESLAPPAPECKLLHPYAIPRLLHFD